MSTACTICQEFHGHNQETHNDYYEAQINQLAQQVAALEAKVTA